MSAIEHLPPAPDGADFPIDELGLRLLGEYELAAFAAMKEVEVAVRGAAQAADSQIGVNLMKKAFAQGGPLRNGTLDPGE